MLLLTPAINFLHKDYGGVGLTRLASKLQMIINKQRSKYEHFLSSFAFCLVFRFYFTAFGSFIFIITCIQSYSLSIFIFTSRVPARKRGKSIFKSPHLYRFVLFIFVSS